MGIFLRHSWNVKPPRWGSPADVQYAIKVNSEKIYSVDPDSIVLAMPLFWGLPPLDYSGKNNHGTNHGAIYKDGSLDFDGTNDYINIPYSSELYIANYMTVSFQIKAGTVNHTDTIPAVVSMYDYAGNNRVWGVTPDNSFDPDCWAIIISSDGSINYRNSFATQLDLLQHNIVITADNQNKSWSLYQDGVFKETIAVDCTYTNQESWVRIGGLSDTYNFDGFIDEVRISNVARTADQIALFHDLPWALYQPLSRPIYFFSKVTSLAVTLPIITADISGEQASSLNVTLPCITADILGGGGGFLDATLPMITAEIEGRESQSGDLTVTLPCITADILGGGGGFLDATLPMITAEMRGGALLEATLPCITAEIEGKTGIVGEIDVTLPIIVADIEGKVEVLGDINAILPVIRAHITGKAGKVGSIDVTLPMIKAALTSYQEVTGDLNATLPMITARIVGTPDRFATCTPLRFTEPI